MKPPKLKAIDLKKCCNKKNEDGEHWHPDIRRNKRYLIKHGRDYYIGHAIAEWFGWTFDVGHMWIQLDKPGTNGSEWKGMWEIL